MIKCKHKFVKRVRQLQEAKRNKKGGFEEKIFLEYVEEAKDQFYKKRIDNEEKREILKNNKTFKDLSF